jgi:hypothetical protein
MFVRHGTRSIERRLMPVRVDLLGAFETKAPHQKGALR